MYLCLSVYLLAIYPSKSERKDIKGGQRVGGEAEREEVRRKRRTVKAKGKAGQLGLGATWV